MLRRWWLPVLPLFYLSYVRLILSPAYPGVLYPLISFVLLSSHSLAAIRAAIFHKIINYYFTYTSKSENSAYSHTYSWCIHPHTFFTFWKCRYTNKVDVYFVHTSMMSVQTCSWNFITNLQTFQKPLCSIFVSPLFKTEKSSCYFQIPVFRARPLNLRDRVLPLPAHRSLFLSQFKNLLEQELTLDHFRRFYPVNEDANTLTL